MHPARRRPAFLSAVIAAILTVVAGTGIASALTAPAAGTRVGASHPQMILTVGPSDRVSAGEGRCGPASQAGFASGACVAAEDGGAGSQVLLDTNSVIKYNGAQGLLNADEQPVVSETVARELDEVAARKGFSGTLPDGVSVIPDDASMALRGQMMQQLRMFGAASQGMENDAAVGATALGRSIPLITTDNALANAVMKLGGEVRFLEP
jgi:rRNA-processing protein FCF1